MNKEIKAPGNLDEVKKKKRLSIFLAGSIEGDTSENWQKKVVNELSNYDVYLLNPRRDAWDNSWEQKIDNPQFNEQVTWELDALDLADLIILYFDPTTKSPISLLELGLHAKDKKLIVVCQEPFYRKGNVDIVCEKYGIPQADSLEELLRKLKIVLCDDN